MTVTHDQEHPEPGYWLVAGLEWRGGELAEAAFAVAPEMILRDTLSNDAGQILGCADLYATKGASRVVFFSDLTRMFASAGHSWAGLGVDWPAGLDELRTGPHPVMFLTISERAHLVICDPAADHDRELLRRAVADKLAADWPSYLQRLTSGGRVSPARRAGP